MKINEIKEMTEDNLKNKLLDLKKELISLNAKRARGSTLEKPALIKNTKKTIARILTVSNMEKNLKSEVKKNNE